MTRLYSKTNPSRLQDVRDKTQRDAQLTANLTPIQQRLDAIEFGLDETRNKKEQTAVSLDNIYFEQIDAYHTRT